MPLHDRTPHVGAGLAPAPAGAPPANRRRPRPFVGAISGLLAGVATAVYLAFAVVAYLRYPAVFSPGHNNWLSDLGSRSLNPAGAIFYRTGCAIAGVVLIAFFASLVVWRASGNGWQTRLLAGVQVLGIIAGFAMAMTGVYPEDLVHAHQLWSRVMFAAFACVLFVSAFTFGRPGRRNIPLILVAATGYLAITGSLVLAGWHWLEWVAVVLLLGYVSLLGAQSTGVDRRDAAT